MKRGLAAMVSMLAALWLVSAQGRNDDPPGAWEVLPRTLVSGDTGDIRLRYRNGPRPLPPGSGFSMELEPISVSQLQSGITSEGLLHDPDASGEPRVSVTVGGVTETGTLKVRITLDEGLAPGGLVTLRYGNRQLDGRIASLVNPVPVHDLAWDVRYVASKEDGEGVSWSDHGWTSALPRVDIKPAEPARVRVTAPSLVAVGKPFKVRVAVTDRFDSRADPPYQGIVTLQAPAGMVGLPESVRLTASDGSVKVISGVRVSRAGVYRIGARLSSAAASEESPPVVARADVPRPIYWGVLRGQAGYTGGWGDGADAYYRYAREVAGLDYAAITERLPARDERSQWRAPGLYAHRFGARLSASDVEREVVAAATKHARPGEFVTILGCLSGTSAASSHAVYTLDGTSPGLAKILPPRTLDFPFELHAALAGADPLIIHHANAAYLPYSSLIEGRTSSGKPVAPVIECHSDRGMAFPGPGPFDPLLGGVRSPVATSLFRVVGRGIRLGMVGDSGTLTGWPGRRWAAGIAPRQRYMPGLTAVRAGALSRAGVLDAYRARDVYATTGERIVLSFTINGVGMGRTVVTDGPAIAAVEASGTGPIRAVSLFNGDRVLSQSRFADRRDVRATFELPRPEAAEMPYLVEVVQADGHRAWSSPIWVRKRSAPDLVWERASNNKLYIKNAGTATATRVIVRGHRTDYGFVRPAWKPEYPLPKGANGQIWMRRWSDRAVTLFASWRGEPVSGTLRVSGHVRCDPEPDYSLVWDGGSFRETGPGQYEFSDRTTKGRGVGLVIGVAPQRSCSAKLTFSRDMALRIDGRTERGREFTIPLNRVGNGSGSTLVTVPGLAPGARYPVGESALCWMADPNNVVAEANEGNNLWVPAGRR